MIHSSFVPPAYPPSVSPLKDLKQIFIKDLRLGIHHRGNYLLTECITPPKKMTAIMAVVEDEREDATVLQLYQQDDRNERPATSILDLGDVLLIKEPFFKVMGDGEYGIRVDQVSDVIPVMSFDKIRPRKWTSPTKKMKTALDWKAKGNVDMGNNQHWKAIQR